MVVMPYDLKCVCVYLDFEQFKYVPCEVINLISARTSAQYIFQRRNMRINPLISDGLLYLGLDFLIVLINSLLDVISSISSLCISN